MNKRLLTQRCSATIQGDALVGKYLAERRLTLVKIPTMGYGCSIMKQGIHPKYHDAATVTCSCGNTFETGSTEEKISVEVCSACPPFYTGKSKLVDTAGRVDKFQQRLQDTETKQQLANKKKEKKRPKKSTDDVVKIG